MKRLLIAFLASAFSLLSAFSQNLEFVMLTAKDVNFRKSPSTQSAKLVWADDGLGYALWSNSPKPEFCSIQPYETCRTIFKVLKRQGEWAKIELDEDEITEAWVSAKFLKPVQPLNVSADDLLNTYFVTIGKSWKKSGDPNVSIVLHTQYLEGGCIYYLNEIKDGKAYSVAGFDLQANNNVKGFKLVKSDRTYSGWVLVYGKDWVVDEFSFDFNQLTDEHINSIYKQIVPEGKKYEFYTVFFESPTGELETFEQRH